MKIAFFTHYFPPEGNAPASRTHEHCKRWVEAGHQVSVITGVPNVPDGVVYEGFKNRIWPQVEMVDGIKVVRTWTFVAANAGGSKRIMNYLSYMFSAVFAFLFFVKRPNVIVATSPQFFCGWAGIIASWLKWRPVVLEIRDIWPESIVAVGAMKTGIATKFLEWLERKMYRRANHIVAVGNGYRENILGKVPVEHKISVVTNGVDTEQFFDQPKDTVFVEQIGATDKFICAYVGTIGMAHGLEVVVEAAKLLRENKRHDIMFCLVGDGANRAKLEEVVQREHLQNWVRFTGRIAKAEVPTALASSDCLLVHLKNTDLFQTVIPSKIFEAMAMGRPLIMGVPGEAARIVAQSKAGVEIEPENATQLYQVLCRLQDDDSFRQSLTCDLQYLKENYSRDALAAKLLSILKKVARPQRVAS